MKLLEGYVKNKTKEAALAALLMTLTIVSRNYRIVVVPGLFSFDISNAFHFAAASMLAWGYTVVLSLGTLYFATNLISPVAFFVAAQVIFFLSKIVGRKRAQYTGIFGEIFGFLAYGVMLHAAGMMDFRFFILTLTVPDLFYVPAAILGPIVIWRISRRLGIVE